MQNVINPFENFITSYKQTRTVFVIFTIEKIAMLCPYQ